MSLLSLFDEQDLQIYWIMTFTIKWLVYVVGNAAERSLIKNKEFIISFKLLYNMTVLLAFISI